MRIRLLGTAAGGGFPQWNCNCANCGGVRTRSVPAKPRTQSCVAVSADGQHWFLLNASPDVGGQIESFSPLGPPPGARRGTGIDGVVLTNADLDHTLGLLQLREGRPLNVIASAATQEALDRGLRLSAVLSSYCGIRWQTPSADLRPLMLAGGEPSGLLLSAFAIPSKPPRYGDPASRADSLGYRIVDTSTGGTVVFLPDMPDLGAVDPAQWEGCGLLLVDGTFWTEDEMSTAGVGTRTAREMGHQPVGGAAGSLAVLARLAIPRKIYIHINNTNPMLLEDSPERAAVEAAGVEVGMDGMEIAI
ncbi:MAG: pyrroloquinoline quinone biosynthesis protein PqqB [Capsulimonadaceae bacterium]